MTRPHKYRAQPVEVDGIRFDSKREARRYGELKMLERAGEIRNLELQPEYPISINGEVVRALPTKTGAKGRPLKYIADFAYFEGQRRVVEDVKSTATDTEASRLRRAIISHIYGVEVRIV